MASCECCWDEANARTWMTGADIHDEYRRVMAEHEKSGCAYTKYGEEGARLRAGQFWENGKDKRLNG